MTILNNFRFSYITSKDAEFNFRGSRKGDFQGRRMFYAPEAGIQTNQIFNIDINIARAIYCPKLKY